MKKINLLLIALVALMSFQATKAQTSYTLDLGSSFSPAWAAAATSGTASNIGSSGINCTVSMAVSGSGALVSPYPRVNKNNSNSSDFVVQGSADAMEVDLNLGNRTSYVDITFAFSAAVQNVSFAIADIDMPGGSSPFAYIDQVTVSATGPAGTVLPSLSKYNSSSAIFNISGNVATANTGSGGGNVSSLTLNNAAQDGTMFVNFNGNAVTTITIRYGVPNTANVNADPGLQAIAFGNITFQKSVPPVTTNVTNSSIKNTNGATAISALAGTDDESVASYTIKTLPPASSGTLQYNNGTSYVAVAVNQVLTPAQAASLTFDPLLSYTGNAVFTYTATDNRGVASNTSNFTIPVTFSTLPVKLSDFSGTWYNNHVSLTWTTQQELNAASFIVEKSSDGNSWQTLTTVAANGNSNIATVYYATDAQPYLVTYYRLKQVDKDGAYEYSKVIKVMGTQKNDVSIRLYPNPVVNTATIATSSTSARAVVVKVFSSNGTQVKEFKKQLNAGFNTIDIPSVNTLTTGIYTVVMEGNVNGQLLTAQFVKN